MLFAQQPKQPKEMKSGFRYSLLLGAILINTLLAVYGIRSTIPSPEKTDLVVSPSDIDKLGSLMVTARTEALDYGLTAVITGERLEEEDRLELEERKLEFIRRYLISSYRLDESKTLSAISRMQPAKLEFNPHFFIYGGAYIYSVAATLQVGAMTGWVKTGDLEFYLQHPDRPARLYITGRILSVFASVLFTLFTYLAIRDLFSRDVALVSSWLICVTPIVILHANYMKPHMWSAMWTTITLYFAVKILRDKARPSTMVYVLAGCSAGLAAGSVYKDGLALWWIIVAIWLGQTRNTTRLKHTGLVIISAFGAFLITNPYWLFSLDRVLGEISLHVDDYVTGESVFALFSDYIESLYEAVTPPTLLLFVTGSAFCLWRGKLQDHFLLVCAAPLFVFNLFNGGSVHPHYVLPLLPLFAACAARMLVSISRWKVSWGVLGFALVWGLTISLFHSARLVGEDRYRIEAGRWINENVRRSEVIAVDRITGSHFAALPPFRVLEYEIVELDRSDLQGNEQDLDISYYITALSITELAPGSWEIVREFPLNAERTSSVQEFFKPKPGINVYRPVFVEAVD
jgi:hypothetical protein